MMYLAVYLHTANDNNGNPRRGWVIYEPAEGYEYGHVLAFLAEGYEGRGPLLRLRKRAEGFMTPVVELGPIYVSPSEYNRFKKEYGNREITLR